MMNFFGPAFVGDLHYVVVLFSYAVIAVLGVVLCAKQSCELHTLQERICVPKC